jgi:hypothetical protein
MDRNLSIPRLIGFLLFLAVIGFAGYALIMGISGKPLFNVSTQSTKTGATQPLSVNNGVSSSEQTTNSLPTNMQDTRPVLKVGVDSFGSYFVAMQIAQDPNTPFRLEIIPFGFNGAKNPSEAERGQSLANGDYDLLFTTEASYARLGNVGKIIFVIDQSDGADAIVVKNMPSSGTVITSFNDLKGKSICVADGNVDHFLVLAALRVVKINPSEVTWVISEDVSKAGQNFIDGKCDAVATWDIATVTEKGNGHVFLSSVKWHNLIDVAVASDNAIANKKDLVQSFTYYWMKYAKSQADDLATASLSIANWTYNGQPTNDWTYVYTDTAKDDMITWLTTISQAGMAENIVTMQNIGYLKLHITAAREAWANAGMIIDIKPYNLETAIDPQFVLALVDDSSLINSAPFVNTNYQAIPEVLPPADANELLKTATIATLPCEKFDFEPDSDKLSDAGKKEVEACAVAAKDMILSSQGQILITGSAAWPSGVYESQVYNKAYARALAVSQVFIKMGIPTNRIAITVSLPPTQDRGSIDENILAPYRYVKIEVKFPGL